MASGGLPHQPIPAAFMAHFGKDSLQHSNAGLLDSRGPAAAAAASASALPPPEIHPRHIVPDERDAFISWLRGEFAAANAIIDAMCHHLRMIAEPSEYDFLFTCIQQRRYNWTLVLHMQQFFSVAEVIYALQQATWRRQQARSLNQPLIPPRSMEDLKESRALNLLRGLKGEVPNAIPQSEVLVSDVASIMNRDLSLSDPSRSREILNTKRLLSPVAISNEVEAPQGLSKSTIDPAEQSSHQISPHRTMAETPEGRETIVDHVSKTSNLVPNPSGSYGGNLFSTDFTALSKEEQDARLPMIKVSKHFQCWEHVDGSLVNVSEGLELYENVLNTYEASQVASLIAEMQFAGRRGEFGGKTFVVEKRMTGAAKEVIQFGTDNNTGSGELLDPMPLVFNSLIDRLILWHILPASKRPDYCSIEVIEEGEGCPPFLSFQHVDQYFCCIFLMAESTIVFGHKLALDGGDQKNRFKLSLPSGSALVIQGNSAEVATRAVVPSSGKRIMVTFAKLLGGKVMDVFSSGARIQPTHTMPPNSFLPPSATATWPPLGLPGGGAPPGVHGLVPAAMMKHIGMAGNASGVLPIPPPLRPFAHGPHPIPQHLVTAPGNVQAVVPSGPARAFPPMGVLSPPGWPVVPPRAPPRPPNTGTGVFFPASSSGGGGNIGRPLQMQPGLLMMAPLLQKSEPLVPFPPMASSELQPIRSQKSIPTTEQGDRHIERGDSLGSWPPSSGADGGPTNPKKATRKESAHGGLKLGINGNSAIKEEQQQRSFHRSNKAGGSKN